MRIPGDGGSSLAPPVRARRRVCPLAVALGAAAFALAGCGGGGGKPPADAGPADTGAGGTTSSDGPGPDTGGLGLDGGGDLGPNPPFCGNQIVETDEACDGSPVGCGVGQICSTSCTCQDAPAVTPTSQALIGQALAAGTIDTFTSLLYRAYAFVGDEQLPPAYDGDYTVTEDNALFLEISAVWGSLTATQQAALLPYTVRPTDPASIFSTVPAPTPLPAGYAADAPTPAAVQCPGVPATGVSDWRSTTTDNFVIWACGGGDPTVDATAGQRAAIAAIAEQVFTAEKNLGAPRPDSLVFGPSPTTRTDVYLVPTNRCVTRNGVCRPLTTVSTIAAAQPDAPCDNTKGALTSSGYMLLRLDRVPTAIPDATTPTKARSDFAHEFFHLVSYGLNLEAQGGDCSNKMYAGAHAGSLTWLTEASGVWAEWAYARNDDVSYRTSEFDDLQARMPNAESMLDVKPQDNPAYQAFAYPLFLCQEGDGTSAPFEGFWKASSGARTPEALTEVLDGRFPFDGHMRDYAVQIYNTLLPGNPISPLFNAADSAIATGDAPVPWLEDATLVLSDAAFDFGVLLQPLAAQYQAFTVPDSVHWIDVDLSTAADADKLSLDALVDVNGTWKRYRPEGLRLTFCRDDPAADVSQFELIISNHGHKTTDKADSKYQIKTAAVCPDGLTGSFRAVRELSEQAMAYGETTSDLETLTETWTLSGPTMTTPGPVSVSTVNAQWSATFEHHYSQIDTVTDCPDGDGFTMIQTEDGTGSGAHTTPLVITPFGNGGGLLLSTNGNVGSFDAPITYASADCDGVSVSTTDDNTVSENVLAVAGSIMLLPDTNNSNHFAGSATLFHDVSDVTGGQQTSDWTVTWDITRAQH